MVLALLGACAGPRPPVDGWQGEGRAWFDAELVRGFAEDGRPFATLAVSVQHRHLVFRRQGEGYSARYRIRAVQRDAKQALQSQQWTGEIVVADFAATRSSELLRQTVRFALDPSVKADVQLAVTLSIEGTRRSASRILTARALDPDAEGFALAELVLYCALDADAIRAATPELAAGELPDPDLFRVSAGNDFDMASGPPFVLARIFDLASQRSDSTIPIEWSVAKGRTPPSRIELPRRGVENAVLLPIQAEALAYGDNEIVVRVGAQVSRSIVAHNLGVDLEEADAWAASLRQIEGLATPEALQRLREVSEGSRAAAWQAFWAPLDPTPEAGNERLQEHYRRVSQARQQYADGTRDGATSDRGRIYVLHGEPDRIEDIPPRWDDPSQWQLWHYDELGMSYFFRQSQGGHFRLAGSERV